MEDEILAEFVIESTEALDQLDVELVELERRGGIARLQDQRRFGDLDLDLIRLGGDPDGQLDCVLFTLRYHLGGGSRVLQAKRHLFSTRASHGQHPG